VPPRSPDLHYVPYGELDSGRPSVVVDGSPAPGTVLCLSHWPGIGSPARFAADLSAEMAFAYLDAFDLHPGASVVSNNHFDQDGLVSVFAMTRPEEGSARRELLTEVARAGDFAVTSSRDAARISMTISAFADPDRSPLRPSSPTPAPGESELESELNYGEWVALLHAELLPLLTELCDHPERYADLWAEEDASLTETEKALGRSSIIIEEVPELDLAVVTMPDTDQLHLGGGHRFGGDWVAGAHPLALHNATDRGALLVFDGERPELRYRYESWVQFRSRAIRPRVDLVPLAERLNDEEPAGEVSWRASAVSSLTPTLALRDGCESTLDQDRVRTLVEQHLRQSPPAWDPYRITR
jgi:hypothetical protein